MYMHVCVYMPPAMVAPSVYFFLFRAPRSSKSSKSMSDHTIFYLGCSPLYSQPLKGENIGGTIILTKNCQYRGGGEHPNLLRSKTSQKQR